VYVDDLAKGVLAASKFGKLGEVYNLASGQEIMVKDLARKIIDYSESSSNLLIEGRREWDHSGRRFGDPNKSGKELNFRVSTDFDKGLRATISWTKENYTQIQKTISKHGNQISL
jgi:nucleoside-diphosphate-sugar epimerase